MSLISNDVRFRNAFNETITINELAGNTAGPYPREYIHQFKLMESEFDEMTHAIQAQDRAQIRDGIADCLFTCAGLIGRMGFNWESIFDRLQSLYDVLAPTENPLGALQSLYDVMRQYADLFEEEIDDRSRPVTQVELVPVYMAIVHLRRLAHFLGIDWLADWEAVNASQWSKFDITPEVAEETFRKFEEQGIEVYQTLASVDLKTYYITHSAKDQLDAKGRMMPKGKWLKSVLFKDVDFSQ